MCGCGGGGSSGSLAGYNTAYSGAGYTPGGVGPLSYEVTFPDGTVKVVDNDTEAYRLVRLKGGGVRPVSRS